MTQGHLFSERGREQWFDECCDDIREENLTKGIQNKIANHNVKEITSALMDLTEED